MSDFLNVEYIGITTCYNFGDALKYTINKNINLFKKWYIITDKKDKHSIDIINNYNINNIIEIIFFDFSIEINKGKAISFAQKIAHKTYPDDFFILIDADTFITDELKEFLITQKINKTEIKNNLPILAYTGRIIVEDIKEYENKIKFTINKNEYAKIQRHCPASGYFQMYFYKNFYYPENLKNWNADSVFAKKFKLIDKLPYPVIHLGKINRWKKQKNYSAF